MATGFVQRFKGKIMAASLVMGPGNSMTDSASGIAGKTDYMLKIPLPVTATANTDYQLSLPAGAVILNASVYTTTAYTAVTDAKIQIGSTLGGADYVATVTVKAIGLYLLTLLTGAAANLANLPTGSPNFFVRIVQSGGSTAVGNGYLLINYVTV